MSALLPRLQRAVNAARPEGRVPIHLAAVRSDFDQPCPPGSLVPLVKLAPHSDRSVLWAVGPDGLSRFPYPLD